MTVVAEKPLASSSHLLLSQEKELKIKRLALLLKQRKHEFKSMTKEEFTK